MKMQETRTGAAHRRTARFTRIAMMVAVLGGGTLGAQAKKHHKSRCSTCKTVAHMARQASRHEALSDFYLGIAKAQDYQDFGERRDAWKEAWSEYVEARSLTDDQHGARLELCGKLAPGPYDPEIEPEDFCSPEEIAANPNPYFPLVPGTTYIYEGETEEGLETIRVHVTHGTREILGVTCVVVEDTVWLEDDVIEDTKDWYAQDKEGNVWYFGELTFEFEDGEITGIEGSWEAGKDGAKPGITMFADPEIGVTYRQEFLLGEAEDIGEVLSLSEEAEVPYGAFGNCLQTADYTPIDPDVLEYKYYAFGVGFILEVKPGTGESVELISIETESGE